MGVNGLDYAPPQYLSSEAYKNNAVSDWTNYNLYLGVRINGDLVPLPGTLLLLGTGLLGLGAMSWKRKRS
jgi:hypothetical protein